MSNFKTVRVVSGEASESDEELPSTSEPSEPAQVRQVQSKQSPSGNANGCLELADLKSKADIHYNGKHQASHKVNTPSPGLGKSRNQSAVVSGEASESSEDELEIDTSDPQVLPLRVNQRERGDSLNFSSESRPESRSSELSDKELELKYDTLFHRKLREKNANLRKHLCETLGQIYISSAKEIRSMTQGLLRSLVDIQDVSENMRGLTNTLFSLEDKVDIISGCSLLPNIDISPVNTPTSAEAPPSS